MADQRRVVVQPPSPNGGRRVRVDGETLGVAHGPEDVKEFVRRAGLAPDTIRLDDAELFEWQGGGPGVWAESPP
ncbi:hypothetical protein [Streptomyces sp. NPDC046261]|uniref:hypothetical protein n=1 Tax=Streptomyces sp. NPDC046261 TaxID=3157200 RepID=UPI0033F5F842